ncbi:MAG TPA: alpha/beta-hydrolase family protein, partial [Euzebyales bacterium]
MRPVPWRDGGVEAARSVIMRTATWVNPLTTSPSGALETSALLDSFGPSLMPRTSTLQGAAAGLNLLVARGVARAIELGVNRARPADLGIGAQLATRVAIGLAGAGAGALPRRDDEHLTRAGVRSAGHLVTAAAVGGALHDSALWLRQRYPAQRALRPTLVASLAVAGVVVRAGRQLADRDAAIDQWPIEQHATVPRAVATAAVVSAVGTGLARSYVSTRRLLRAYLGDGWSKDVLARAANAALWGFALSGLYNAGVAYIGRANEKVEPGYARPPVDDALSGGPRSLLPYGDLGQQGRRYVTDVVTPEMIADVMGEPALAHPIRTYVGFNSEPVYQSGRAELALAELDRTGAFDRSHLLLVCPTGTGWIDQTMIEATELFTRGDIATCCIQYGRYPSFL